MKNKLLLSFGIGLTAIACLAMTFGPITAEDLIFKISGTERFRVQNNGLITVGGTNSSAVGLSVSSGNLQLVKGDNSGFTSWVAANYTAQAGNTFAWSGRSSISSPADGTVRFTASGGSIFNELQLGNNALTNILLRNIYTNAAGRLQVMTGDGSDFADIYGKGQNLTGALNVGGIATFTNNISVGGGAFTVGSTGTTNTGNSSISGALNIGGVATFTNNVVIKGPSPWVDVTAYGADKTGVANSSTAIQSAIDSFGRATATITRGTLFFPQGTYRLDTSLICENQSIQFIGQAGTIIKWNGNNTTAMFDMIDCSRCVFDTLIILGKDSSQPTAGIWFDETTVSTTGTDEFFIINNVSFGRRFGAEASPDGKMQRGIYFNGATECDSFTINNCQFHDCTTAGIDDDNGNAIWGKVENCTFNFCGYGIKTGCDILGVNLNFNRCTVADVWAYRQVQVMLKQVNSEHSLLPFLVNQGASLHVDGGRLNVMSELTGSYWADCAGATDVSFRNYWVYENGATGKKLRHTGNTLYRGSLFIRSCDIAGGDDGSAFEFEADVTSSGVDVDIAHGPYRAKVFKRYSTTYNPPSIVDGNFVKTTLSGISGTDIVAGDFFMPSFSLDLQGMLLTGQAATGQKLAAIFQNESGGTLDLASGTLRWKKFANEEIRSIGSATFVPADQNDGNGVTTTVTVPGATLGDFVYWSDTANTENWLVTAYVSSPNTVSVRYQNESGGVLAKASGTLTACVLGKASYVRGVVYDPPSLVDAAGTTTTITVPGALLGDFVIPSFTQDLQGMLVTAWVSAANTVSVRIQNETGGTLDLASGILRAAVFSKDESVVDRVSLFNFDETQYLSNKYANNSATIGSTSFGSTGTTNTGNSSIAGVLNVGGVSTFTNTVTASGGLTIGSNGSTNSSLTASKLITADANKKVVSVTGTVSDLLTGSATLDFPSTAAQTSSELTITVTGAADGDVVMVSPPNSASNANSCFTARVSSSNTVTVKFNNYSSGAIDPASATFKVVVFK